VLFFFAQMFAGGASYAERLITFMAFSPSAADTAAATTVSPGMSRFLKGRV